MKHKVTIDVGREEIAKYKHTLMDMIHPDEKLWGLVDTLDTVIDAIDIQCEVYTVTRVYRHDKTPLVLKTGLTRKEAVEFCQSDDSSSSTCTDPSLVAHTQAFGDWMNVFDKGSD